MKKIFVLTLTLVISVFGSVPWTKAIDLDIWRQDQTFTLTRSAYSGGGIEQGPCFFKPIKVMTLSGTHITTDGCVTESSTVSIAKYRDMSGIYPEQLYAVKMFDEEEYRLTGSFSTKDITLEILPETGYLVVRNTAPSSQRGVDREIYELYRSPASAFFVNQSTNMYMIDESKKTKLLSLQDVDRGEWSTISASAAFSKNGRFMLSYANYTYVAVTDLNSGESRVIDKLISSPYAGRDTPFAGTISNDGRYAFIAKADRVYRINENCGENLSIDLVRANFTVGNPCQTTGLTDVLNTNISYQYNGALYEFTEDNTALKFVTYYIYSGESGKENIMIATEAHKNNDAEKIIYIALGDSYTSGEGDVATDLNGASHYKQGTEKPEGCHLSSQSFPYIVARSLDILSNMHSVACSGARMSPDISSLYSPTYFGQGDRLIDYSFEKLLAAQNSALPNFSPGIIGQLEFVKQYKPKFITVTAGGNDVGFAEILRYCTKGIDTYVRFNDRGTCGYALPGNELNQMLLSSIKAQYSKVAQFVSNVKKVSPSTVIYVVGYPKFISENATNCRLDGGLINLQERKMMNESVYLLNEVTKSAAKNAGAYYVDIENSLVGGRMCEGSGEYVTGLRDLPGGLFGFKQEDLAQVYHPNALGHQKIAASILAAHPTILQVSANPTPANPLSVMPKELNKPFIESSRGLGPKIDLNKMMITFDTSPGVFRPNSAVRLRIYSKEYDLGNFITSPEGTLQGSIRVPKHLEAGIHLLVADGLNTEGKRIKLYDFVHIAQTWKAVHQCESFVHEEELRTCASHSR